MEIIKQNKKRRGFHTAMDISSANIFLENISRMYNGELDGTGFVHAMADQLQ